MTRASIGAALTFLLAASMPFQSAEARGQSGGALGSSHPAFARSSPAGLRHQAVRPALTGVRVLREQSRFRVIGPGLLHRQYIGHDGFNSLAYGAWGGPFAYGYSGLPYYPYDEGAGPYSPYGWPSYPPVGAGPPADGPPTADAGALYQANAVGLPARSGGCRSQEQLVPSSHGMARVVVTRC